MQALDWKIKFPDCVNSQGGFNYRAALERKQEAFIYRIKSLYPQYSYLNTEYVKSQEKVIITCHIHGDFKQTPNNLLNRHGCPKCGDLLRYANIKKTPEKFFDEVSTLHPKLDFSNSKYLGCYDTLQVICKVHDMQFPITATKLLQGQGCPACSSVSNILYLLKCKIPFLYKVGITSNTTTRRLSEINCNTDLDWEVLFSIIAPNARVLEREILNKYKQAKGYGNFDGYTEYLELSEIELNELKNNYYREKL